MSTYHFISHTHWDREWYLPFETFRAMLVRMMDETIELLETKPAFRAFTLDGQSVLLEDYLAIRPEKAETLRRLGKTNRLFAGPWYVLPDEFLVSGEALVRNLLIGSEIAGSYNMDMRVGYIPDSFGHAAAIPSILRGFGIDNAILYRGFGGEPDHRTSEYRWRAPDGSEVLLVHLHKNGYSAAYFHEQSKSEILKRFRSLKRDVDSRASTPHRLLLNGGDHHWPDGDLPSTLEFLRSKFPDTLIHGTLPEFIGALRETIPPELPSVEGELRSGYKYAFVMHGGVYSSRMYLKQENRASERLLERYAEPLHAFAVARGMRPLQYLLRHSWKELLKNHPHDSICGCSIDAVHRDMMTRFAASQATARSVIDTSLEHLLPREPGATKDDTRILFFNPSPRARSEVVDCELRLYRQDVVVGLNPDVHVADALPPAGGFALIDGGGNELPLQLLSRREDFDISTSEHGYPSQTFVDVFHFLVRVENVPPLGYRGFRIEKREWTASRGSKFATGHDFIDNGFVLVEARKNGCIDVTDFITGGIFRGLHVFEDGGDTGDEYSYSNPEHDRIFTSSQSEAKVTLLERGPCRASLRISMTLQVPTRAKEGGSGRTQKFVPLDIESVVSIDAGSPLVSISSTVTNRALDHRLRVLFPTHLRTNEAVADSAFCLVRREAKSFDPEEYTIEHPPRVAPMLRFVGASDWGRALTLFTDGLPEYEFSPEGKGLLALTLLRCVGQLGRDGLATRPGGSGGWHNETPEAQCQGTHHFRYALLLRPPQDAESVNAASERFHAPLLPFTRKNSLPLRIEDSLLGWTDGALVPSAVKLSEDGRALILRWWNPTDEERHNSLDPRFDHGAIRHASFNETVVLNAPVDVQDIVTPPSGITTLRVELPHQGKKKRKS